MSLTYNKKKSLSRRIKYRRRPLKLTNFKSRNRKSKNRKSKKYGGANLEGNHSQEKPISSKITAIIQREYPPPYKNSYSQGLFAMENKNLQAFLTENNVTLFPYTYLSGRYKFDGWGYSRLFNDDKKTPKFSGILNLIGKDSPTGTPFKNVDNSIIGHSFYQFSIPSGINNDRFTKYADDIRMIYKALNIKTVLLVDNIPEVQQIMKDIGGNSEHAAQIIPIIID